jgi:hypothetical protein
MDAEFQTRRDINIEKPPSQPKVIAHAPFVIQGRTNQTEIDVTAKRTNETKAGTGVKLPYFENANAEVTYTNSVEVERKFHERYYQKGASNKRCTPGSSTWTAVWWNLEESGNPEAKDDAGISPDHRFAVLIERASNAKFIVKIRLNIEAGWSYKKEKILRTIDMHGPSSAGSIKRSRKVDWNAFKSSLLKAGRAVQSYEEPVQIEFDPEKKNGQMIRLVNQLGKWADSKEIVKLTI